MQRRRSVPGVVVHVRLRLFARSTRRHAVAQRLAVDPPPSDHRTTLAAVAVRAPAAAIDRCLLPAPDLQQTSCTLLQRTGNRSTGQTDIRPLQTLTVYYSASVSNRCIAKGAEHILVLHTFNGPFSWTMQVSRYQKGKTNLDFTEARGSEWQWHQLGHMQVCTSIQTTTPAPHH